MAFPGGVSSAAGKWMTVFLYYVYNVLCFLPARCGVCRWLSAISLFCPCQRRGCGRTGSTSDLGAVGLFLPKTVAQVCVSRLVRILCKIGNLFTYLFLWWCNHGYWTERQSLSFYSLCCLLNVAVQILAAVHAAKCPCDFWTYWHLGLCIFCYSPFDTENLFLSPGNTARFSVGSRKSSLYNWTPPNTPSFREKYYLVSTPRKAKHKGWT